MGLATEKPMCLLALFFRVARDAPVVVGANREEFYARGGEPPAIVEGPVRALAGVDPLAGGTWLGVNEYGVLAAVTNRPREVVPPQPRSRGLLTRSLLGCASAGEAVSAATRELGSNRYAGCNLLLADRTAAYAILAGDWLRVRPLPPGIQVLTASDVNDASDRRLGHALWWLEQRPCDTSEQCLSALMELCVQAGPVDPPMCLHGSDRGTVSSTVVALHAALPQSKYLHAQGPPDKTPYEDYSPQLQQLFAKKGSG
jgi:uncharacterized protein with NRDE domain